MNEGMETKLETWCGRWLMERNEWNGMARDEDGDDHGQKGMEKKKTDPQRTNE